MKPRFGMARNYIQALVVVTIAILLFFIPFGWLKDGQVDFGGDSSRLYFYEPLEYLKNQSLYSVSKSGLGGENFSYYALPHFLLVYGVSAITQNPTITISVFYGITLSLAFLFVYFTLRELLSDMLYKDGSISFIAGLVSALYYIFPPQLNTGWRHVILTFYQLFLNPLMFYLLLRFFVTSNFRYMATALLFTVLFSPNFSYVGAPPFFAFYPMSLLFLFLYTKYVKKQAIPVKGLVVGATLFLLLQLFHMLPIIRGLFYSQSANAADLFSAQAKLDRGLGYFTGIAGSIRVSLHLLGLPQLSDAPWYAWAVIVFPFVLILGGIRNVRKTYALTVIFFLIALFWVSAKITNVGFEFYKTLFHIPGFSMFRNFYGQWGPLFLFFYAVLLGQAFAHIMTRVSKRVAMLLSLVLIALLVIPAVSFLRGDVLKKGYHWQSYKVSSTFALDPSYEEVLTFIRSMPNDGKFLILPFTDPGYQVIAGKDGGAYEGPSTIAYLTDKQDFSGYQELGVYKDLVIGSVRRGDREMFQRLMATLGVRYIFYNSDPTIYDLSFPYQPYSYMRGFFPVDQASYKTFIDTLGPTLVYSKDNKFFIYKLNHTQYLPEVYVADSTSYFDKLLDDRTTRSVMSLITDSRPALFEYKYRPQITDTTYRVAQADSIFLRILKNPEPPRLLHHSFVTTQPGSYVYPLIMLREEFTLMRLGKRSKEEQIDRRLFLSAKRMLEMEKWGGEMSADLTVKTIEDLKRVSNTSRQSVIYFTKTSNWEVSLGRYLRYFEEVIDQISTEDPISSWAISQKFIVTEYLLQHRSRFEKVIPYLPKSSEEKAYLEDVVDFMFNYLHTRLGYGPLDLSHLDYRITYEKGDVPHGEMLIEDRFNDVSDVAIRRGGAVYTIPPGRAANGWYNVGAIDTSLEDSTEVRFTLTRGNPENLMDSAKRTSISNIIESTDSATLTIDTSLIGGKGGLIWEITRWEPENIYLLSFDFRTKNAPFDVRLVDEEIKSASAHDPRVLLENQLATKDWQQYQAVVKSSSYANTAFLQFSAASVDVPISNLEIRNPTLYRIPHPAILVREKQNNKEIQPPVFTVEKVHPSFYRVHIENPDSAPVTLVLNQKFSGQWKLINPDGTSVDDAYHFEVNKFANAWHIDPKKFNDANIFDFTIETEPQQIFYKGLVISTVALIIVVYLFIRRGHT